MKNIMEYKLLHLKKIFDNGDQYKKPFVLTKSFEELICDDDIKTQL